jgi:tRNA threonylcarbamoyl adenosine modification protein YjeE
MPSAPASFSLDVPSETGMAALGAKLARHVGPGDVVLLSGPIGAGKTHLARALIQSLLDAPEDVPSPTFTLVQTYRTRRFDIWHADLYRLADSSELVELGLDEAIGDAVVLIEWPDRLPLEMAEAASLRIDLQPQGDSRRVRFTALSPRWNDALAGICNG